MDVQPEEMNSQRSQIENALDNVLSDKRFKSSPQMSAFLRYIVSQTLDGHANRIKAYTIAVDALGKPDSFDPQSNPSVRVLARRLRTSLIQYYAQEGENAKTTISIKLGSYVPTFDRQQHVTPSIEKNDVQTLRYAIKYWLSIDYKAAIINWYRSYHRRVTLLGLVFFSAVAWNNTATTSLTTDNLQAWDLPSFDQNLPTTEIASLESMGNFVERPETPVIVITSDSGKPIDDHGALLYNAISNYENITLNIKNTSVDAVYAQWPEQYELQYSYGAHEIVNAMLIHSQSGTMIHTETLDTNNISPKDKYAVYQTFGKKLLNTNGILMNDYKERGLITPRMECVFLFDNYYMNKTRRNREAANSCNHHLATSEFYYYPVPFTL